MDDPRYRLTEQEARITNRLCAGATTRELMEEFGITHETVKRHLSNIFDKTGMSTRVELVVLMQALDMEVYREVIADLVAALRGGGLELPTYAALQCWEVGCPACQARAGAACRDGRNELDRFHRQRLISAQRGRRKADLLREAA